MSDTITIWVPGIPKGQPRVKARAFAVGGKTVARVYTPKAAEGFKSRIHAAAADKRPGAAITGPVRVDIACYFPRPKGHYGSGKNAAVKKAAAPEWHTSRPDRDNIDKAVLDALTTLGFWRDDAQVCGGETTKKYADRPEEIGCAVTIAAMDEADRTLGLGAGGGKR